MAKASPWFALLALGSFTAYYIREEGKFKRTLVNTLLESMSKRMDELAQKISDKTNDSKIAHDHVRKEHEIEHKKLDKIEQKIDKIIQGG